MFSHRLLSGRQWNAAQCMACAHLILLGLGHFSLNFLDPAMEAQI